MPVLAMIFKDPESDAYLKGQAVGRWLCRIPFLRLLLYPIFRLYVHWSRKPFRAFRARYPALKQVAFVVYSEAHQHEYMFGESGILRDHTWSVVSVNYREELMGRDLENQDWIIAQFVREHHITLKQLPFGVVFTPTGLPAVYRFSNSYRKRRRDKGKAIDGLLSKFTGEIDTYLDALESTQAQQGSKDA